MDNQLILNEITVSRNHCLLTLEKNKYGNYEIKMEDESSKFGSLILIQTEKIEIIKGKPLHIQVSNIHMVFQYKKKSSLLSCCNVDVVDDKNSYEKMNYKAVKNKNVVNILTEINSDDDGENNEDITKIENNKKKEKKEEREDNNENKEIKINTNNGGDVLLLKKNNNNVSSDNKENIQKITDDKKEDNINNDSNINGNKNNNKEFKKENENTKVEEDNEKK